MVRPTSDNVIIIAAFAIVVIILVYCARLLTSQTVWLKGLDARVEARDKRWEDVFIRVEAAEHRILELQRKQAGN